MCRSKIARLSKKYIYGLGIITLFGFGLIGTLIIVYFHKGSLAGSFSHGLHWLIQLLVGLAYGSVAAYLAWHVIHMAFMDPVRNFFATFFKGLSLNIPEVLFLSFCAGVGEEILFRAAIQPYLGIWVTSIIFIAMHGYLNPMNWRISVYGGFMVLLSSGLGYLFDHVGLVSAMSAHFIFDVILLAGLLKDKNETDPGTDDGSAAPMWPDNNSAG